MDKFKASEMLGSFKFNVAGVDLENYRIPVILSDETEVVRYNWDDGKYYLTLKHGEENVDLSRADILSLFVNHNTYELPIGKFEDVRLEENKLKAWAVFDNEDDESMKIFRKLAKGFLQSFSVGINVLEKVLTKEVGGIKYYDVTSWSIDEASVVGIPAIPTAKVGLKQDDENNGVNRNQSFGEKSNSKQGNVMTQEELQALNIEHAEALDKASVDGQSLERSRVSAILALSGDEAVKLKSIEDGLSVGDTAIALNKELASVVSKQKVDFEAAAEELAANNPKVETEELSDEAQKEKEADEALAKAKGVK